MANIFQKWFGKKEEMKEAVEKVQETLDEVKLTEEAAEEKIENPQSASAKDSADSSLDKGAKNDELFVEEESFRKEQVYKEEIVYEEQTAEEPKREESKTLENIVHQEETIFEPEQVDEELLETEEQPEFIEKPKGFFSKLKEGLSKTRNGLNEKVNGILANFRKIDEEFFEELEEILFLSDIGVQASQRIIEGLKNKVKLRNISNTENIKELLKEEIMEIMSDTQPGLELNTTPSVIIMVGVNGVGKTTSIGKISAKLKASGKNVLLAAGDTFRAAAIDQLDIWGKRVGSDVIKHQEGADPGAVIFDAVQAAKSRKVDVLICDTAGRLHNKKNLMDELGKVERILGRELPECSKEVLLVLDATTGQNAVQQAKIFSETTKVTGIVLTKLDGTAKGGIVVSIKSELGIPVKFIGVGEGIDDLQEFNAEDFVNAMFE